MPPYQVLMLRGGRLERWLTIEAAGDLSAIEAAAEIKSGDVMELWQGNRRLATFRPALGYHGQEELQSKIDASRSRTS